MLVVLTKSAKPSDECAFHDFRFYVVTLALISQFAAQLYWINWALGRFESTLKTCKRKGLPFSSNLSSKVPNLFTLQIT